MSNTVAVPSFESRLFQVGWIRRLDQWLNVIPHSPMVIEIAGEHVAAARWGNTRGNLEACSMEPLQVGSVMASPMETNITQPDAVRSALRAVLNRVPDRGVPVALLVPDPVVRVFILPFDTLPRRADDALPLLRWRLKKSVPFDVDDTVVSWMRQAGPHQGNLEVVAAIARKGIIREYEELLEGLGARTSIVLSSTLSALPLLEERGATLLARICGRTLTTAIVRGPSLCIYRATDLMAQANVLEPKALLEEIFPAIAYYQDTWGGDIDRGHLAGFGAREREFRDVLEQELRFSVTPLAEAEAARELSSPAGDMLRQNLDALVGWMTNSSS